MSSSFVWRKVGADEKMRRWVREQADGSLASLWRACPRGDWLLWHLTTVALSQGRGSAAHRQLCRVALHLALRGQEHWPETERKTCEKIVSRVVAWVYDQPGAPTYEEMIDLYVVVDGLFDDAMNECQSEGANGSTARYKALDAIETAVANLYAAVRTATFATELRHRCAYPVPSGYWNLLADEIRAIVPDPPALLEGEGAPCTP